MKASRAFEKDESSYADGFLDWWEAAEPPGYDHPDTFEPIMHTFINADDEIKELKQRISELEGSQLTTRHKVKILCADFLETVTVPKKEETIAKLREVLEFYSDDNSYRSKHGGHLENKNFHSIIGRDCGRFARTTLKEIFGDEND